jgi:hypothetical protein
MRSFASAPRDAVGGRRAASVALREADRLEAGLRAYARRRPGIGGLVPD